MRIHIVGGGPAGLYFALLMKQQDSSHDVRVFERDGPHDTFGWGIVFSDQTFAYLHDTDPRSHVSIMAACETWDNVDIVHRGERISVRGNRFSGIARLAFLNILQARCRELGVDLRFHTTVSDIARLEDCDLLVGADGANSCVREHYAAQFRPTLDVRQNKYIWLGTCRLFHGLTLTFRRDAAGVFCAHAYKFSKTHSTFIVECQTATWERAGFASRDEPATCAYLESVFADDLAGEALLTNNFVRWLNFVLVRNERWRHGHVVLLGDALHTAHFSIGSGTKLALEDAIALSSACARQATVEAALAAFERERRPTVESLQAAAHHSLRWFEQMDQDLHHDPTMFAYRLMTRSGRIDHEKLRARDAEFVVAYERQQSTRGAAL